MALRSFEDREGNEWRVWSVVPAAHAAVTLDEEYRGGWLCFERIDGGDRCRLTLTEAPAAWDSLPDERLDLLRRVALPVAASPPDTTLSETTTGKRPIENAARDRPSGPKSVISGIDSVDERP
jgi:hypothetical protein